MSTSPILYVLIALIFLMNGIMNRKPAFLVFAIIFLLLAALFWSQQKNK